MISFDRSFYRVLHAVVLVTTQLVSKINTKQVSRASVSARCG